MAVQAVDTHAALRPLEINACAACNLFWFDKSESVRLAPRAVLGLFEYIGRRAGTHKPLATNFDCPRCGARLAATRDLQRTTQFTYWRCPDDHGRLITFHQFLREKNFIRAPAPAELAKLRATVRQIACSQCGAPIDLAKDTACTHCAAPVALIDPEGVAKALNDLSGAASAAAGADPEAVRTAIRDAQLNAIFEMARSQQDNGERSNDLVTIGAAAIGALVAGLLR